MPITTNSGGVLHTLSPIYVRNGGVLNELSTVYARTGSVLSTIYEKDSGSGGGGGGGEVTPPVDPTRTETFHWGNYTGTANTTPVCIGNFTIDKYMFCSYDMITLHNMEKLCSAPSLSDLDIHHLTTSNLRGVYYYGYNIYIKKSLTDDENAISWEYPKVTDCNVTYKFDNSHDDKQQPELSANVNYEFSSSQRVILEAGTYYVLFSNYITFWTCYETKYGSNNYFVKYLPWDNMLVDVTLTLEPTS